MMQQILVIDDHIFFGAVISEQLAGLFPDARVLQAQNGREGIRLASKERPDVIFLDTHMPLMDGYEVAQALQTQPQTRLIPLIAMTLTGNESSKTLANLRPLCQAVLYKPFKVGQLEEALRQIGHLSLDPQSESRA